jgi:hypothetical protein
MAGGTLHYLLVVANPAALTPYDPASTGLPGDEHYSITSQRRGWHPWIAQLGTGPDAGPDISVGGQQLAMPLGHAVDGECQVRVIDERGAVTGLTCGADILVDEGNLGLTASYTSNGWVLHETRTGDTSAIGFGNTVNHPYLSGFIIFGSGTYSGYIEKLLDGTEDSGPHWTPGQIVGLHFRLVWSLDTGPGNIFAEVEGATTERASFPNTGTDFWNIDPSVSPAVVDGYLSVAADSNGEVKLRLGGENYGGSCNVYCEFRDVQIVSCELAVVSYDAERYTTSSLADDDARQRMLGRPYYLKASTDGGVTFDEMLYAGFLRDATMERSLTYLMTGGDSGRGRRIAKAWRGLNPLQDFTG